MNPKLKQIIVRAQSWPEEMQEEAVHSLLSIEESHAGTYHIDDDEWADLREGLEQADRGEFVPDAVVAEADKRYSR
jgi:predicted transcriptional regulator